MTRISARVTIHTTVGLPRGLRRLAMRVAERPSRSPTWEGRHLAGEMQVQCACKLRALRGQGSFHRAGTQAKALVVLKAATRCDMRRFWLHQTFRCRQPGATPLIRPTSTMLLGVTGSGRRGSMQPFNAGPPTTPLSLPPGSVSELAGMRTTLSPETWRRF